MMRSNIHFIGSLQLLCGKSGNNSLESPATIQTRGDDGSLGQNRGRCGGKNGEILGYILKVESAGIIEPTENNA